MTSARTRNQARARVRGGRAWVRMGRVAGPRSLCWMTPGDLMDATAASIIQGAPSPALDRDSKEAA